MELVYSYDFDDADQRAVMFAVMDVMRGIGGSYDTEAEHNAAELAASVLHRIEADPRQTYQRLVYSIDPSSGEALADLR
jgi:hypothetical protein